MHKLIRKHIYDKHKHKYFNVLITIKEEKKNNNVLNYINLLSKFFPIFIHESKDIFFINFLIKKTFFLYLILNTNFTLYFTDNYILFLLLESYYFKFKTIFLYKQYKKYINLYDYEDIINFN